jgi:hypothetical protein
MKNIKTKLKDFIKETKENGVEVDLALEYENMLRNKPDDSERTVDDFLIEFGVDPKYMTGFGWASILKNAQQYSKLSNDEFKEIYNNYKDNL